MKVGAAFGSVDSGSIPFETKRTWSRTSITSTTIQSSTAMSSVRATGPGPPSIDGSLKVITRSIGAQALRSPNCRAMQGSEIANYKQIQSSQGEPLTYNCWRVKSLRRAGYVPLCAMPTPRRFKSGRALTYFSEEKGTAEARRREERAGRLCLLSLWLCAFVVNFLPLLLMFVDADAAGLSGRALTYFRTYGKMALSATPNSGRQGLKAAQ